MFEVADRDRVRDRVLELASSDQRVVAAAFVGASARGEDRWSDLDLTFGVAGDVPVAEVLEEWSRTLVDELDAVHLFDLPAGPVIYRVFLLPGCLQVDLSFAPASEFGARGPHFALLFGEAAEPVAAAPPSTDERFGLALHHAVRARICIERGRVWQAEYWLSAVRDETLALACVHRGLEGRWGRGFDRLPADVLAPFEDTLVRSLQLPELERALGATVAALLRESAAAGKLTAKVEAQLRELVSISATTGK